MVWLGGLIVILTFVAIIKRYETRMVLFLSGVLMALLSQQPWAAFAAFQKAMVNGGLVPVISTVMGFAFVMKYTKCDAHLVHLLAAPLTKARAVLIPGAVLVTFLINIALPSAAGCAAAVGAILIPTLMGAGVHPAIAASAVLAGTWGSAFNPGNMHNPYIAKLANISDPMVVIGGHTTAALAGMVVVAVVLTAVAMLRKEDRGYEGAALAVGGVDDFKVNIVKAIVPVVPLLMLVAGSLGKLVPSVPAFKLIHAFTVPEAMIIGVFLGFLVNLRTATSQDTSKQFFAGMGEAYASVIGIIIGAAVFNEGMKLIGLTGALIDFMKHSESIAKIAATFGPFIVAVLSGSGDAATLAFNGAITPHAKQFGFDILPMGSTAFLTGALGRSMSPVAGAAIVCAGLAGINPMEITRRNWPAMVLAAIVVMFILL
ncbi:C4-dicarboxylate transporter DcuC [Anaeroselena agilis]|uniref:C4-dicarboxylate transporter DcuC n=1 Tax=Anaeroselena agilis TaxID=3063788 RepID=A0ABU3NVA1_9FIRM|nr:C4-dicarboxylate transporter DcuC [Selenomonadales bacterium 4137-cl]